MNRDHARRAGRVRAPLRGRAGRQATMVAVDRLGFKLRLRRGQRLSSARIAFPREVTTAAQSRGLIGCLQQRAPGADSALQRGPGQLDAPARAVQKHRPSNFTNPGAAPVEISSDLRRILPRIDATTPGTRAAPSSRDSACAVRATSPARTCPRPPRAGSCRGGMAWR